MEFSAYIAKSVQTVICKIEGGEQEVFLILETKDRIPTVAPLGEADVDLLISELKNRRRELRSKQKSPFSVLFSWFHSRWQAALSRKEKV